MNYEKLSQEIIAIILAIVFLTIGFNYKNTEPLIILFLFLSITIFTNVIIKKITGVLHESDVIHSIWTINHIGFSKKSKLKTPLPMIWFPLFVSFFTSGFFQWMPILTFNVEPKPERASKRHGIYRFSEITEHDLSIIVFWGIFANLILSIISYLLGFELLSKFNTYYAISSVIPISRLDGSKLFFGNRILWAITTVVTFIFFILTFTF